MHQRTASKRAEAKALAADSAEADHSPASTKRIAAKAAAAKLAAAKPAAAKAAATEPTGAKAAPKKSATRDSILRAAAHVFARHGYDGGSVEKISRRAKSVDRMIYYYFGSKEGLFVTVLEQAYERMNAAEATLSLDLNAPAESLTAVIRFMHGYYRRHPNSSRCSTPRTCTRAGTLPSRRMCRSIRHRPCRSLRNC